MIELDNETVTHLLGYLDPDKWADALKGDFGLDNDLIKRLIKIQEEVYAYSLSEDVKDALMEAV